MAKIVRYNGNLVPFASSSLGTERTIFGQVTQANDITSQYTAEFLRGWGIVGPSDQPTLQDFNAVSYTHGQILSYLHQVGVAEYNATQEYHLGSFSNVSGVLYFSLVNNNVGNSPATSPAQWKQVTQHGISRHTTAGSFTVPAGVTTIYVSGCAGGGGGGGSASTSSSSSGGGGGGGAGESIVRVPFTVTPGQVLAISIGGAGTGGALGVSGLPGGTTALGSLVTLNPGLGGLSGGAASATASNGGTGASGFPGGSYGGDAGTSQPSGAAGGAGASGPFGGGGRMTKGAAANAVPGGPAFGFGAGGGGAGGVTSNVTGTGAAGANGAPGLLIIEW